MRFSLGLPNLPRLLPEQPMCVHLNRMEVEEFFNLFTEELKHHPELWTYYKFLTNPSRFAFRKAYFCQRLQYIKDHIGPVRQRIWDCGSGYGTTGFFLAMNGYRVHGSTLEFYIDELEKRKSYWSKHGDVSLFSWSYENVYDVDYHEKFDTIILQDTLHHLEPVNRAFEVLHKALKPTGRLLVVEENGSNLIQNIKLIKQRGFTKVKEIYDEKLQKKILIGDENIRGIGAWKKLLASNHFVLHEDSIQYIRLLPPSTYHNAESHAIIEKEHRLASKLNLLRRYFYFGINFTAHKKFA